ncbi:SGNH/GDSL hydrolase family protein [Laspinema olomoucense]|uniref:SGNH/GDSL hydrolase family protein n=1 Tax=Laspinema olomoucense TaxID=3231600 RepID=UPI0021BA9671|nr:SGNH/GDSL hydrolase family protein [Laspinema sp. D3c]MCT7997325.1 GDSL-type esterase/lipase family protein [Laspinema sp. D3c]
MVWSNDSSIYEILAGLSEADIRRSLVGNNTPIRVGTDDAIASDSPNDLLLAGSEDDLLIGDVGNDTIYGGSGNNTLSGGTGHLIAEDWEGEDFLIGGSGDDLIFGNQADDTLYGGDGDDTLYGGKDSDRLEGNGGNDLLSGDLGSDTLSGGEGQNRFQIGRRFDVPGFLSTGGPTLDHADWIMDFTPGQDLIELLGELTFDELNIFAGTGENAGDTIIQDTITQEYLAIVKNIPPEAIARDNFWPYSQPPLPSLPPQNPRINPSLPLEDTSPTDVVSPGEKVSPIKPNPSSAAIAFSTIRYTVLDDNTPALEITLIRQNALHKKVSVTVTLHKGITTASATSETTSAILPFNEGETAKTVTIPLIENKQEDLKSTFSLLLSNPTGGAKIELTNPVIVTLPEQQQPDSIIFNDDNLSKIEEEEPSDLEPDISSEIEEEEPSDLEPDVPPETEEEEPSDLEPDISSEIEEEEPSDLEPDVSSETEEEEPSNLEPDVSPETEEEEPSDLEPDISSEIEEEEPSDLEPDISSEIEEEEPSDLEPDISLEIEEEEPSDLEPDVPPETEEEEPSDLEPDVPPETEEQEEEPIPDKDETPPIEDEQGEDTSGEIEDDPVDEEGDDGSGDDSEISTTANYSDAASGIIADLSEGIVTRLFTTDEDVPFKILPLGDSNTRGYPNQASIGGYRTRLWERLVVDNGFNIDFVGQAKSGPEDIDRDHEGRGGFTIPQLIENSNNFSGFNQPAAPLYSTIENALNYDQPDAILLMAGTNDILQNKPVETALTDLGILVDRIITRMPEVQVLVSSIIPHISNEPTLQQRTQEFSQKVEKFVVAPRANNNPNIRFVDMFNLPFVAGDYDKDGIHLNASGYDKLADEWYSEIRMLPSGEESLTDVHNIIGSAYDDTLIGNDASNKIRGGEGNDWLSGGAGEDTFILASGEGTNTIADFESGSDRIGLTNGLQFEQLVISPGSDASQTQIAIANTGESLAILRGIHATLINADDFILV